MRCRARALSYNALVFRRAILPLGVALLVFATVTSADAASARIIKVLPQLIDLKGRNSVSPSLYERDAYQEMLRKNPEKRSGIRFVVQWTAKHSKDLVLRVEMRGVRENSIRTEVLAVPVKKTGIFSKWTSVALRDSAYRGFGDLVAWRATLWDGNQQVAEQKSFLW
jgi:hypothetical protein